MSEEFFGVSERVAFNAIYRGGGTTCVGVSIEEWWEFGGGSNCSKLASFKLLGFLDILVN